METDSKPGFWEKPLVQTIIKIIRFLLFQHEGKKKKKNGCDSEAD